MTEPQLVITGPGVYPDMSDVDYHADPVPGGSLSSSGARKLLPPSCPAKFRYDQVHGQLSKPEWEFGKAAHHRVLGTGPEIFVLPYDSWRSKEAREERDEIQAGGGVAILEHENQVVADMANALAMDPIVGSWFVPDRGYVEYTLVWRDHRTGVMRRARLDWLSKGPTSKGRVVIVDYKTCTRADLESIAKAVAAYGYHCQGDWYKDGVCELGLAGPAGVSHVLIFQEKTPPYVVTAVELDEEALMWGDELNKIAIDVYRHCTATGYWPGYTNKIERVELPRYAVKQYEIARALGPLNIKEIA